LGLLVFDSLLGDFATGNQTLHDDYLLELVVRRADNNLLVLSFLVLRLAKLLVLIRAVGSPLAKDRGFTADFVGLIEGNVFAFERCLLVRPLLLRLCLAPLGFSFVDGDLCLVLSVAAMGVIDRAKLVLEKLHLRGL
jgi:hypothetical protein